MGPWKGASTSSSVSAGGIGAPVSCGGERFALGLHPIETDPEEAKGLLEGGGEIGKVGHKVGLSVEESAELWKQFPVFFGHRLSVHQKLDGPINGVVGHSENKGK
jgi:hypothetical protein